MFHFIEPFFCDGLLVRIEAQIDSTNFIVEDLYVFKVGELGHKDIDITDALTKEEYALLAETARTDYVNTESKHDGLPDPMELSKRYAEEKRGAS